MREMVCIVCPIGCHLAIERLTDGDLRVTGNRCARGERYAREELLSPHRVVTATCGIAGKSSAAETAAPLSLSAPRRIPLRTQAAFPREKIPELLGLIYGLALKLPVERGQVAIADALGTGIDVIVTRSIR